MIMCSCWYIVKLLENERIDLIHLKTYTKQLETYKSVFLYFFTASNIQGLFKNFMQMTLFTHIA